MNICNATHTHFYCCHIIWYKNKHRNSMRQRTCSCSFSLWMTREPTLFSMHGYCHNVTMTYKIIYCFSELTKQVRQKAFLIFTVYKCFVFKNTLCKISKQMREALFKSLLVLSATFQIVLNIT